MAKKEGVRRIVMTGRLIVLIGIALGVLLMFVTPYMFRYSGAMYGVSVAFRVAALGGVVWATGWIADGFTRADP